MTTILEYCLLALVIGVGFFCSVIGFSSCIRSSQISRDEESGAQEGEISHLFATAIDNDLNRGGF